MTIPAFVSKGTVGSGSGASSWSASTTLPGTINAGDIIIIFVSAITFAATVDSINTPSGYTLGNSAGVGGLTAAAYFYKVADGSEDSTSVTSTGTASGFVFGDVQSYVFSNSGTGGHDACGGSNSGSSSNPAFASLTTTTSNALAVGLTCANNTVTIGSTTGETGGNWTEAAAEDAPTSMLQCQTAQMVSAGTLSGGTSTLSLSAEWFTFSFALREVIPGKAFPFSRQPMLTHHIFR